MKFEQEEFVLFKLTGEIVMVLEQLPYDSKTGGLSGYYVRFPDKKCVKVAEFELQKRTI